MKLTEELKKLNEIDEFELVPFERKREVAKVNQDGLNEKLLKKIKLIAEALALEFEAEGIDLDADLIADDIKRDCGLMGDIIDTDELDMDNPFDAATKEMHDMGPIDKNMACQTLLNVPPHEFVAVFIDGLKRERGLLPGGMDRRELPHPHGRMELPHRRFGESIGKDYSYIDSLVKKFSAGLKECKKMSEDLDEEKESDECFFELVFKEKGDAEEKTERYTIDEFDDARADFIHMSQGDLGEYEYVVLRKVCTDYKDDEEIEVVDSFGLDESLNLKEEDENSLVTDAELEIELPDSETDVFVSEEEPLKTFEEKMDFLAADEDEAIAGYHKILEMLGEEDAHIKEQLEKILEEEEAHKKFLQDVKENRELEYSHEEHKEEEEELPAEIIDIDPIEIEEEPKDK